MITVESVPEEIFQDLLNTYWMDTEDFPKPEIIIANDVDEAIARINLEDSDYIIISIQASESFQSRGNCHYYDRVIPGISANILSKVSRQRIRNLSKMVRAIMADHKWDFSGYQIVKPAGYKELVNTDLNIWRAEATFRIEAHAILIETLL